MMFIDLSSSSSIRPSDYLSTEDSSRSSIATSPPSASTHLLQRSRRRVSTLRNQSAHLQEIEMSKRKYGDYMEQSSRNYCIVIHSGKHKPFAELLCRALEANGCPAYFDRDSDSPARSCMSVDATVEIAATARLAILLLSEEFFSASKWPMLELSAFVQKYFAELHVMRNVKFLLPVYFRMSITNLMCTNTYKCAKQYYRPSWFLTHWENWARADSRVDLAAWENAWNLIRSHEGVNVCIPAGRCVKTRHLQTLIDDKQGLQMIVQKVLTDPKLGFAGASIPRCVPQGAAANPALQRVCAMPAHAQHVHPRPAHTQHIHPRPAPQQFQLQHIHARPAPQQVYAMPAHAQHFLARSAPQHVHAMPYAQHDGHVKSTPQCACSQEPDNTTLHPAPSVSILRASTRMHLLFDATELQLKLTAPVVPRPVPSALAMPAPPPAIPEWLKGPGFKGECSKTVDVGGSRNDDDQGNDNRDGSDEEDSTDGEDDEEQNGDSDRESGELEDEESEYVQSEEGEDDDDDDDDYDDEDHIASEDGDDDDYNNTDSGSDGDHSG